MTDNSPSSVATITSQIEGVGVNDLGTPVNGVTVYFTTAKGVKGSVFVPKASFTQENVFAAIASKAALMDGLHGAAVPPAS